MWPGIVTLFFLTDWPHQAKWLAKEEQEWISAELQGEKEAKAATRSLTIRQALAKREIIVLALVYFLSLTGLYGFNFWFPTILKGAKGLPNMEVTLIAALPYVLGVGTMLLNGWSSDHTGKRRWHTTVALILCGVFPIVSVASGDNLAIGLGSLILTGACTSTFFPSFWALPTALLSESAAAASIGLINSVGNLGGGGTVLDRVSGLHDAFVQRSTDRAHLRSVCSRDSGAAPTRQPPLNAAPAPSRRVHGAYRCRAPVLNT